MHPYEHMESADIADGVTETVGPKVAVHGGAFFERIGVRFDDLSRRSEVINADVLDAWYDPAPSVVAAIAEYLPWLIRTSPPTHGEGLREEISEARGVPLDRIAIGSGSSSLMFTAIPLIASTVTHAVVLDPCYGEYPHLLEHVIGCQVSRIPLPLDDFRPDARTIAQACAEADLLVLVNPNSPTGVGLTRAFMVDLLGQLPPTCRVWLDETYIDFMPGSQSLEPLTASEPRLIVSKSMSKFYALSGLRVGYLVAEPELVERMATLTPPWSVGLIGQLAAVEALKARPYYEAMTAETHRLRGILSAGMAAIPGWRVIPSDVNFVMAQVPDADAVCARLRDQGIFIRQCDSLSPRFHNDFIRIAVKSEPEIAKILEAARYS